MSEPTTGGSGAPASTETGDAATSASLLGLLTGIAQALGALLAGKLRLAEIELSRDLATLLRSLALLAAVGVLTTLALGLAGAGLAMVLAPRLGSPGGALLLVAGIYLIAGLAILIVARSRIKKMGGFLSESRTDLKRDAEWLKNLS